MTLEIFSESTDITLKLINDEQTVDSVSFSYYHDLDQVLITYLDKLLKRNSVDINSVKGYKILGNIGIESTSHKIIEAFIEGLKA